MNLCEILAINLRFYRRKYNLSQERFAEVLDTSLCYLNRIENCRVNVKISTIDKFVYNLNYYDKSLNLNPWDLLVFDCRHITYFSRVDERSSKGKLCSKV